MATLHYGTSEAREVTPEQFKEICALLEQARLMFAKAKEPGHTLAQKRQLKSQGHALRNLAMQVGPKHSSHQRANQGEVK